MTTDPTNLEDPASTDVTSLVMTVDEVAQLLRISRGLAFAACRAGTLPHVRVGRRILIPRHAVEAFLDTAGLETS